MTYEGYMNIQDADPDIIVDLKYATTDNFTAESSMTLQPLIARIGTAKKLAKAAKALKEQGYRIKVWDAYRSTEARRNYLKSFLTQLGLLNLIQITPIKKALLLTSPSLT